MPTYEYKCKDCGDRTEVFQQMTDEPLTTCEECSGSLKRLIGAGAGIIFKGSGFYCTDYRNDKGAPAKAADTASTSSTSSETAKTETATASATPAKTSDAASPKKEKANV